MRRVARVFALVLFASSWLLAAQRPAPPAASPMLTVDSIMRGPKLVGNPPTAVRFSRDSAKIYFSWQRAGAARAATFVVGRDGTGLRELSADESRAVDAVPAGRLDRARRRVVTAENGDIVIIDVVSGARRLVTRTSGAETSPRWARNDSAITFMRDGNLFLVALESAPGAPLVQLTDIVPAADGAAPAAGRASGAGAGGGQRGAGAGAGRQGAGAGAAGDTEAQRLLREQERDLIDFIRRQVESRAETGGRGGRGGAGTDAPPSPPIARLALSARQAIADLQLSADERFVWATVTERPEGGPARGQDTPNYVTESAYPEMIPGRPNVGDAQSSRRLAVMNLAENSVAWADLGALAGVERKAASSDRDVPRLLNWTLPDVSDDGALAVVGVRALDNKDRWLVKVDPVTGKAAVLDALHDEAWIREQPMGGATPGGSGVVWLPDSRRVVFLSEKSGRNHLYVLDVGSGQPARALTSGKWEVTDARLSADRRTVFLTTNEVHPGERQFYTLPVEGGRSTRITAAAGAHEVLVAPDEQSVAVIHSASTRPPDLFVMPLQPGAAPVRVTTSPVEEWSAFKWIEPRVLTYKARDGAEVYARLYTPEMIGARRDPKRPAVIFVHGAGYLQNAHKYWSTYYREFMFHHILAARGYVVLDPDYRASAGYGRDWRTAIYRHMGGHDLNDVVDGARFLVETEKVDPRRLGVYGGSYGGFITLMAMFTSPDTFAAGAALRPVTDWSHYNHGYTSNILNTPQVDRDAFKKSSPIFFAEGLKGRLLILHGMVDTNVFFQDSVRLVQRLIELRKENWEITPYPVENHGFTEETSWADEYRRILRLFEDTLRK